MLKMSQKLSLLAAAGVTMAALAGAAFAAGKAPSKADYGAAVSEQSADLTITLTAATKRVNVTNGDTVKFVYGEQSFTWHFETALSPKSFDLALIAPKELVLQRAVKVYVANNPLYQE
jgi:Heavy-metal resistance protein CzcE